MILRSPISGRPLRPDGHALRAGDERWPVIDAIPYLRANRRDLANAALAALDSNDTEAALILLLGDQDSWARDAPPDEAARRELSRTRDAITFRDAMALLRFGPVADYFAHRWSDPTYLSGLALAEAHWGDTARLFEVACGAGHYLRAFAPHARAGGGDVVFAKLWLARHFVAPDAALVCFDAAFPWPIADDAADTVFCHDAFYFLPDKPRIAAEMRRVAPRLLVGHAHNAGAPNFSSGAPLSVTDYAALLDADTLYDDAELTAAWVSARAPRPSDAASLRTTPAVSFASGAGAPAPVTGRFGPAPGTPLHRNPLYGPHGIAWPSDRYRDEYAALATYPAEPPAADTMIADASDPVRRRAYVDLPARW